MRQLQHLHVINKHGLNEITTSKKQKINISQYWSVSA